MSYSLVTKQLTPVFNTPDFDQALQQPQFDVKGLWNPLETLLCKHLPVDVVKVLENGACRIQTEAYPSSSPLYTHVSFLKSLPLLVPEWKKPSLPPLSVFLSRIRWCVRKEIPYLWGGNAPKGTDSLRQLYRLYSSDPRTQRLWKLQGVDCSGLLYWALRGAIARNTSGLVQEGSAVAVRGLSNDDLAKRLKPGMLIVWKGHVLVVIEKGIVDSTPEKGVCLTPTLDKINEIRQTRIPIDTWPSQGNPETLSFVVRDLYPEARN